MRIAFLTFVCLSISFLTFCKAKPTPVDPETTFDERQLDSLWKKVDSLEERGLVASARDIVLQIKKSALASQSSLHLVKAAIYENKYANQLEEDATENALQRVESEIKVYPEPAASILHSLVAQWYYRYLQSHLWEMRDRSDFSGSAGDDIRTWSIRQFVKVIQQHFDASVEWKGLKGIPVNAYKDMLTAEDDTDHLRPTMYDILMHRAIDFYSGEETYLTNPAYAYTLTDPAAFAPVQEFVRQVYHTEDSTSHILQELNAFQQLLLFRLEDQGHREALLDADLKRLQYVYNNIVTDGKDSLFERALLVLLKKYDKSPESPLIVYQLAYLYMTQADKWVTGEEPEFKGKYVEAMEWCNKAITEFPNSYGGQLCQSLIHQMKQEQLNIKMESVLLPGEKNLAFVEYRNLSEVYLKVARLPVASRQFRGNNYDPAKLLAELNQLPVEVRWRQELTGSADFQPHTTEIAVPSLTYGHYALVVSDTKDFDAASSTSSVLYFTVSELGYWFIDDRGDTRSVAVVNRMSGQPQKGVRVRFYAQQYNANRRQQEEILISDNTTDSNGWAETKYDGNRNLFIQLNNGKDELFQDDMYYTYASSGVSRDQTTLFFTDRAIYRPGQKIYFKGYLVAFDSKRIPAIIPNREVEVKLYDVNGREVDRKTLRSNGYGTFSGQFDLPLKGLKGRMSLGSSVGNVRSNFSVEEYKRPKFEVTFDTIKTTYKLNDLVTVTGSANDYAGTAVSSASFGYRVERVAFRPWWYGYWWRHWPVQEDRQLITSGQGFTDDAGKAHIEFKAIPKPGGSEELSYRFEITLYVTDITGESHETFKSILLNHQGYEVISDLKGKVSLAGTSSVSFDAHNTENIPLHVTGTVEAIQLVAPDKPKRERLWESPDVYTLTKSDYASDFPAYYYPGEETMDKWKETGATGKLQVSVHGKSKIDLSALFHRPGYYKLNWIWKNVSGHDLVMTQYTMVYDTAKQLPGYQVFIPDWKDEAYQPGDDVHTDLLTGLGNKPSVLIVEEHRNMIYQRRWSNLPFLNAKTSVTDADRGGVINTYLLVYNNRFITEKQSITVPWSNKDLDVALKTWRDKMEPGSDETWTLTVLGEKGEKVNAELLLSMYDASLDAFIPHQWSMRLYPQFVSQMAMTGSGTREMQSWTLVNHWQNYYYEVRQRQYRDLNQFGYYPEGYGYGWRNRGSRSGISTDLILESPSAMSFEDAPMMKEAAAETAPPPAPDAQHQPQSEVNPPLRAVLDETVFFYPDLTTDKDGNLNFNFKMKEGLTRWKFQALAHTKLLAYGYTSEEVVTQKKLMVFPNPPRFFRAGDTIAFQAKITNATEEGLNGHASLKIIDAFSREDISSAWGLMSNQQSISIKASGSSPVSWPLRIPVDWIRPVLYQVSAVTGAYTDGEESMIPVVTNRILVTESLPLPLKANETRTFVFTSMLDNKSQTMKPHQYVVEMTSSPAWYAVQALPYLMEYPHECAEQLFGRLYANALAQHITEMHPEIEQTYAVWRATHADALVSNLEKNQELRSALLEDTPWVRDAMGETNQKHDIAILFEENKMQNEKRQALEKLISMQLSNGGFPWFPGGRDNWYITQYIVEGFGHLGKLGVAISDDRTQSILEKAIPYIDSRMIEWYADLQKEEKAGRLSMKDHQIGSIQVHYLYARSFFPNVKHVAALDEVTEYIKIQMTGYWLQHSVYDQGLMALSAKRTWPGFDLPQTILSSLREKSIRNDELGRYWKLPRGYGWNDSQVEFQSLMIELFQEMNITQAETDELRVWLLKQKQTTRWHTTKATAEAVYALLIHPDTWLSSKGIVEVRLGGQTVIHHDEQAEAGTGYIKRSWDGNEIKKDWSKIEAINPNNHIAWGSVYWQYWEDMDKVKSPEEHNPLNVSKAILRAQGGDRGEETIVAPTDKLHVGDKLMVRIMIETDRNMEFVHVKDMRASGFEPMEVLSGYRWKGGLGYYQSTLDLSTNFFIDYLPRGKYILEYPVTVAQAGGYSDGMASVQCMYAPEFTSHSAGQRVNAIFGR